jgi:hypothetical protein
MIPGHKHLVIEEGLQSAWLYETLSPHVDEFVVAGITQSRGPKSDKRDAYGLAETRVFSNSYDVSRRRDSNTGADQECLPLTWRLGCGRGCLWPTSPRGVDRPTPFNYANESDSTLRSTRLSAGPEEAGGGRSTSRGQEAPDGRTPTWGIDGDWTGRSCRWVPENDALWAGLLYCDWMPDAGWIEYDGFWGAWIKPAELPDARNLVRPPATSRPKH